VLVTQTLSTSLVTKSDEDSTRTALAIRKVPHEARVRGARARQVRLSCEKCARRPASAWCDAIG